jgi:hypothetical protein
MGGRAESGSHGKGTRQAMPFTVLEQVLTKDVSQLKQHGDPVAVIRRS